jgi:hypothetical protein
VSFVFVTMSVVASSGTKFENSEVLFAGSVAVAAT